MDRKNDPTKAHSDKTTCIIVIKNKEFVGEFLHISLGPI